MLFQKQKHTNMSWYGLIIIPVDPYQYPYCDQILFPYVGYTHLWSDERSEKERF